MCNTIEHSRFLKCCSIVFPSRLKLINSLLFGASGALSKQLPNKKITIHLKELLLCHVFYFYFLGFDLHGSTVKRKTRKYTKIIRVLFNLVTHFNFQSRFAPMRFLGGSAYLSAYIKRTLVE